MKPIGTRVVHPVPLFTAAVILFLTVAAPVARAHHSFGEFDQQRTVEVSGTLTDVAWQNPHVKLKVQSTESGHTVTWDIECHSVGILSRSNLDPKVLKVGDRVKIAGNPSKTSPARMFGTNLMSGSLSREFVLAPGSKPRWNTDAPDLTVAAGGGSQQAPTGLFKVWGSSFEDPDAGPFSLWSARPPLTAAATKALAAWDPARDTIAKGCLPKGMPTIMEQPYGMQFEDRAATIVLRLEEYDTVRVIHMSDNASVPTAKSLLGHSVGRWDGSSLVVTTTGISWPYIAPNGLPQGQSSRMVERFTPSTDGRRLQYSVTITDPDTFTKPAEFRRAWVWRAGESVHPYNCGKSQTR
ncbi:MAG TPA: DUF6152 family protein [Steroidobacteraceae bacterium]|jgi:hypothetical protein